MDFVKMLNDIKENPELLDTFDDQCLIWWNKKDLIDLIKNIVSKYFDKSSNTYNISIQFKISLQSLIDNPKELLELINDCLKPKEIEKKDEVVILIVTNRKIISMFGCLYFRYQDGSKEKLYSDKSFWTAKVEPDDEIEDIVLLSREVEEIDCEIIL
jgi:hypothetical protein